MKASTKPKTLVVVSPAAHRQIVQRLNFHIILLDKIETLYEGCPDLPPHAFALEKEATARLLAQLGKGRA